MALLLKKKKALIYLKSFGLEVNIEGNSPMKLDFSSGVIELLEKRDLSALKTLVENLVDKFSLKERSAVILLSKELLFKKYIKVPLLESVLDFKLEMPYLSEDIACRAFAEGAKKYILGTNKRYFLYVRRVFQDLGWKIKYVVPEFDAPLFSPDNRSKLLKKKLLLKKINFLKTL